MQCLELGSTITGTPRRPSFQSDVWTLVNVGERMVAALLFACALPVIGFAALLLMTLSRRSPLIAHQRVGHHGRPIWVLKLRTMWKTAEPRSFFIHRLSPSEAPLLTPSQKNSLVTSRFASFCRRYSIDELPQLWQVVRGEMALVGPRPMTSRELKTFYGTDTALVTSVKPGISGLWQISGRSRLDYAQRRRLDLFLIREWSWPLYAKILLFTVPRVLTGKDAW